ncbi:hypothetical protein RJ640_006612 [Escallonia rubra]|uniref:Uncharacterized protein n=1 Tax=Escallonia rubra TaxID=112253 RepID=A0AA88RES8_9ASTE|nr:hypothetical protein RJ640_006612 [Escallonia rubra]
MCPKKTPSRARHHHQPQSLKPPPSSSTTALSATGYQIVNTNNNRNDCLYETKKVQEFFSRVAKIVNQIRSYGDTIEENKIVEKILRSLSQRFEHVVTVIEESEDLSSLSRHGLMGSLKAHEKRTSRYSEQPIKQAFQSN